MTKKIISAVLSMFLLLFCLSGCMAWQNTPENEQIKSTDKSTVAGDNMAEHVEITPLTSEITKLEDGLSAVRYEGDDGLVDFISNGGASSDEEVIRYLSEHLLSDMDLNLLEGFFGCSTITAENQQGEILFGRNFDWNTCEAMVVASVPDKGYASLSTVNMDFITQNVGGTVGMALRLDEVRTLAALYAPLDGMNEAGFAISVNMIQDSASIDQDTEKADLTTTTAVRLLLNQAADVEEALELLAQYDLHASMGMMVHFVLADASGRSVVVEYIDNEMAVTETPVVTNFYLAEGEKQGIGTQQSHERYDILMDCLSKNETLDVTGMRDALDSVSKDNFEEFASTEWSIIMNLNTGIAHYYHRENYETSYTFAIREGQE